MKRPHKLNNRRPKSQFDSSHIEPTVETKAQIASDRNGIVYALPDSLKKGMAIIATNTWKARCRMIDPATGEARHEMKRVCGDIERIECCLNELGIAIEDHTNKPFDYGLPWTVIATKPTPGISKEIVTETLRPTVRWNEQIIQHAEVEIGTPANKEEKA